MFTFNPSVKHSNIKTALYFNYSFYPPAKRPLSNLLFSQISLNFSMFSSGQTEICTFFSLGKISLFENPNSYILPVIVLTLLTLIVIRQLTAGSSATNSSLPITVNLKGRQHVLDGCILCWEIIIQHTYKLSWDLSLACRQPPQMCPRIKFSMQI